MSNEIPIVNKEDHQDMFTMVCYCVIPFETSCSKCNLSSDVQKPNFVATKKFECQLENVVCQIVPFI